MFIVATIGFVVNIILLLMLGESHDHSHGHDHSLDHGHGHHEQNHGDISDETISQYQTEGQLVLNNSSHQDSPPGLSEDNDSIYGSCSGIEKPSTKAEKVININLSGAILHAVSAVVGMILHWQGEKNRIYRSGLVFDDT